MKKILLLGGSNQQLVAINKTKELGYYTVLCDYLPDNPGRLIADKYYQESTTDIPAILRIAGDEKIDGILAYASDPAAPTAAYIAEKMGLPSNPFESVNILCNKNLFRQYLKENGFNSPDYRTCDNRDDAIDTARLFPLPFILKPVDSSGSKGVAVIRDRNGLGAKIDYAFSFSRSHKVILEQFIERNHEYLIGGDIFVNDGKIVIWGLMNCYRDNDLNPLVPSGKSYPVRISDADLKKVKTTLQQLISKLGIRFGPMNVELIVDKNGEVWPIDIGPRAGGNMIPDLMEMIFDVDIVDLSIRNAMGESVDCRPSDGKPYYATHNIHTDRDGIIKSVRFDEELEQFIVRKAIYVEPGDEVHTFINSAKALGIIFMKFDNENRMDRYLKNIKQYIHIIWDE